MKLRSLVIFGVVLGCLVAARPAAAQQVEYSFFKEPPRSDVSASGKLYEGWRLPPGGQVQLSARGPGVLRVFFFQEYEPGKPFPTDVRLLVAVDGAGKMFPIAAKPLPGMSFAQARGKVLPSAPSPVNLKIDAGEHTVVLRLAATSDYGGALAFPEALRKGGSGGALAMGDLDLDLDTAPLPKPTAKQAPISGGLDLDLDLPPSKPGPALADKGKAKGKQPDPLALDLDLDLAPAAPAGKPAPSALDLDLDLEPTPKKPEPVQVAQNQPPPPVQPAVKPPPPVVQPPSQPAKPVQVAQNQPPPPPVQPVQPAVKPPPPVAVAHVEPAPPPRPSKPKKQKPAQVAMTTPQQPEAPPAPLGLVEFGPRGGWALSRGQLQAMGVGFFEIGYRLTNAGLPKMRLVLVSGLQQLLGSWSGFEPGRGSGRFAQSTQMVPIEVGVTWEPTAWGRLSPYLGLSAGGGVANTLLQSYSLKATSHLAPAIGASVSAGLRYQIGRGVLVLEARHNESFAQQVAFSRPGVPSSAQGLLSATAGTLGYMLSL